MTTLNRREWLRSAAGAGAALLAAPALSVAQDKGGPFTLPKLPYAYDALEPHIDARTMEIHHDRHHAGYVSKLNAALEGHPELQKKSIEELLRNLRDLPADIQTAVRQNGGGHYNHSLFWQMMTKKSGEPQGALKTALEKAFTDQNRFKEVFKQAGLGQFGSGWAWLVVDDQGGLKVVTTPNQDTPIMVGMQPILGIDVWEHAYYLKYQNKRADYIDAWFNVIDWDFVAQRYDQATKKG